MLGFLPSLFWGIITISLIVFVHELGHFLAARLLKFKVTEFFIGLPGPKISFKRGDTEYGITAIPLGGYVRVPALEGSGPGAELGAMTEEERKEYENVPAWKRITVLISGVVANLVFAIAVLTAMFMYTGIPVDRVNPIPGGPAAEAGLPDDAQIVSINGRNVRDFGLLVQQVAWSEPGDVLRVTYVDADGQRNTLSVTVGNRPAPSEEELAEREALGAPPPPSGYIGVVPASRSLESAGFLDAFTYSFTFIAVTAEGISRLFSPATFVETLGDARSIIGISVTSAHIVSTGLISWMVFLAMLSIALGLMNILPIPPLDGGKIVLEVVQKVIGRPIPQNIQVAISLVGFGLLIILMIYLLGQDLFRIFG